MPNIFANGHARLNGVGKHVLTMKLSRQWIYNWIQMSELNTLCARIEGFWYDCMKL